MSDQMSPKAKVPEETSGAAETVPSAGAAAGSPAGFSKGVNDYLNHYISLADAKAGAIAGLNVALGGLLLSNLPGGCAAKAATWAGTTLNAISIVCAAVCIWPRLPAGAQGMVFWEDIRSRKTSSEYLADLYRLDEKRVEGEYAQQNFFASEVLHRKYSLVRWCIGLTLGAIAFTGLKLALQ